MPSIEVRAEKMAAGGDAIARLADGRVVFVRGALPGELVEVEVVQSKKDFARAEVVRGGRGVAAPCGAAVSVPCGRLRRVYLAARGPRGAAAI